MGPLSMRPPVQMWWAAATRTEGRRRARRQRRLQPSARGEPPPAAAPRGGKARAAARRASRASRGASLRSASERGEQGGPWQRAGLGLMLLNALAAASGLQRAAAQQPVCSRLALPAGPLPRSPPCSSLCCVATRPAPTPPEPLPTAPTLRLAAAAPPPPLSPRLSDEMATWIGKPTASRPEITKFFWEYAKNNDLKVGAGAPAVHVLACCR